MPAPAVIPALIAYVKVVAVKTLVVGLRSSEPCVGNWVRCSGQEHASYLQRGTLVKSTLGRLVRESQGRWGGFSALVVLPPSVRPGVPFTMTKLE